MSDAFADAGRLRQELDSVWKMHDLLKRENADLRAKLEGREKHIGILVSCLRAACASPFNLANSPHWQAAIDAAIAQGKGEK